MNLYCQYANHDSEPVIGFCLNAECTEQHKFCSQCILHMHQEHKDDCKTIKQIQNLLKNSEKEIDRLTNKISKDSEKVSDMFMNIKSLLLSESFQIMDLIRAYGNNEYRNVSDKIKSLKAYYQITKKIDQLCSLKYFDELEKLWNFCKSLNCLSMTKNEDLQIQNTNSDNDSIFYLNQGKQHYNQGNLDIALQYFNQSIKKQAQNTEALIYKGCVLNEMKRFSEAIQSYDEVLKLDKQNKIALNNKSLSLNQCKLYQEALECLELASNLDQNDPFISMNKGISLINLKREEEAKQFIQQAIQQFPISKIYDPLQSLYQESIKKNQDQLNIQDIDQPIIGKQIIVQENPKYHFFPNRPFGIINSSQDSIKIQQAQKIQQFIPKPSLFQSINPQKFIAQPQFKSSFQQAQSQYNEMAVFQTPQQNCQVTPSIQLLQTFPQKNFRQTAQSQFFQKQDLLQETILSDLSHTIFCQHQDHKEFQILYFCSNLQCQNNCLCCGACISAHQNHRNELQSIDEYQNWILKVQEKFIQIEQGYEKTKRQILEITSQLQIVKIETNLIFQPKTGLETKIIQTKTKALFIELHTRYENLIQVFIHTLSILFQGWEQIKQQKLEQSKIRQNMILKQISSPFPPQEPQPQIAKVSTENNEILCCLVTDLKFHLNIREINQILCHSFSKIQALVKEKYFRSADEEKIILKCIFPIEVDESPEDLNFTLLRALQQSWSKNIKLIIILTQFPSKGILYPEAQISQCQQYIDSIKNQKDNLKSVIEKLIKHNIYLLGIRFSGETTLMYHEIANIYTQLNQTHMFITRNIQNINKPLQQEVASLINQVIETIYDVNNSMTVTYPKQNINQILQLEAIEDRKNIYQEIIQKPKLSLFFIEKIKEDYKIFSEQVEVIVESQSGASELFYSNNNYKNYFETSKQTRVIECNLMTIELKEQDLYTSESLFQRNLTEDIIINKLQEFIKCLKTEQKIASGILKNIYLMKCFWNNQNYILKVPKGQGPYISLENAIDDCKVHLIAQLMMKKFMQLIQKNPQNAKYPDFTYTNLVIVEELQHQIPFQYWIAEEISKEQGQFKKYNNNNGFILNESTIYNEIAQAFTCYTYLVSNKTFMVCDIQGFERELTDPVINTANDTTEGQGFTKTNGGAEGIKNYLEKINTQGQFGKELLESIGMTLN